MNNTENRYVYDPESGYILDTKEDYWLTEDDQEDITNKLNKLQQLEEGVSSYSGKCKWWVAHGILMRNFKYCSSRIQFTDKLFRELYEDVYGGEVRHCPACGAEIEIKKPDNSSRYWTDSATGMFYRDEDDGTMSIFYPVDVAKLLNIQVSQIEKLNNEIQDLKQKGEKICVIE